jgi:Ca2+-binding RTX toxin-like protein
MAIKIPSSNTTFIANIADKVFVLGAQDSLVMTTPNTSGIIANVDQGGRTFKILGRIDATENGIELENDPLDGARERIVIGVNGSIHGDNRAINVEASELVIDNFGLVTAGDRALTFLEGVLRLNNSGIMTSTSDVMIVTCDRFVLRNTGMLASDVDDGAAIFSPFDIRNSGTISGGTTGLTLGPNSGGGKLFNEGTIVGPTAILANNNVVADAYEIINRGTIIGDIDFTTQTTADLFDFRNGTLHGDLDAGTGENRFILTNAQIAGTVDGGGGNDTFVVSQQQAPIADTGGGNDTVRSSASFRLDFAAPLLGIENLTLTGKKDIDAGGNFQVNILFGNSGDNALNGLSGADIFRGGKGDDTLTGGDDPDTFFYSTGDGKDTITDFDALGDQELLGLAGFKAIKDFDDLIDNHLFTDGADVVIKGPGGDQIRLKNVDAGDLTDDNFLF